MKQIPFLSIDPSMANTAIVYGYLEIKDQVVIINLEGYDLIQTKKSKNKQIRASTDAIERSREIYDALQYRTRIHNPKITITETPSGSQSAVAMKGYGIACALISTLDPPALEVTPIELKKLTVGSKTASKEDIIAWVHKTHPDFEMPMKGGVHIKSKCEHIADAVCAAHAAIQLPQFKQLIAFL